MSTYHWTHNDIQSWIDKVLAEKTIDAARKHEIKHLLCDVRTGYELQLMTAENFIAKGLTKFESFWFEVAKKYLFTGRSALHL